MNNKNLRKTNYAKRKQSDKEWSEKTETTFWNIKNKLLEVAIKKVDTAQTKIFKQQAKKTMLKLKKALKKKKSMVGGKVKQDIELDISKILLNVKEEVIISLKALEPLFAEIFDDAVLETDKFLEIDSGIVSTQERYSKKIAKQTTKMSTFATQTTNKTLVKELNIGLKLEEGIPDLSKRVADVFGDAVDYRSDRIARTEASRYNVWATEEVYKESGVVKAKKWVIDPVTACQFCRPMNGKILPLDGDYFDQGSEASGDEGGGLPIDYETVKRPPLHPNCNCDLAPVFK